MNEVETHGIPVAAAIVIDRKGYIAGWNEGAEQVLGFTSADVVGRASHHVLCGRDPNGVLVCHPWCVQSPGGGRIEPDDNIVLYPRSADHFVVRVTLSVFQLEGAETTGGWVVHLITAAKTMPLQTAGPSWPRRSLAKMAKGSDLNHH
jgi:PAS domain-containing protein